jgi:hypothetical protein
MNIDTARAARPWREYGSSLGGSAVLHVLLILLFAYVTPKMIAHRWVGGQVIFQPVKAKEAQELAKPKPPVRKFEEPPTHAEAPSIAAAPPAERDFRPRAVHETAGPDMLSLGKDFAHAPQDQIKTVDLSQIPVTRSGRDVSNSFQVPQKPGGAERRDNSAISFRDALPGLENKDGRSPAQAYDPSLAPGGSGVGAGGRRRVSDTAEGALSADLGAASKKPAAKPKSGVEDLDASKWERIEIAGPVAQHQPDCLNVAGYVYVGNYRLMCKNDQIVAAWRKKEY